MSNMSYCRFQNTLTDLGECQLALETLFVEGKGKLSRDEERAAIELVSMCAQIALLVNEECNGTEEDIVDRILDKGEHDDQIKAANADAEEDDS
jgi:hypothetical protein